MLFLPFKPLKHRAIGKQNRVRKLMVGVSVSAILFSLPRFFEVTTVQMCLIPVIFIHLSIFEVNFLFKFLLNVGCWKNKE